MRKRDVQRRARKLIREHGSEPAVAIALDCSVRYVEQMRDGKIKPGEKGRIHADMLRLTGEDEA